MKRLKALGARLKAKISRSSKKRKSSERAIKQSEKIIDKVVGYQQIIRYLQKIPTENQEQQKQLWLQTRKFKTEIINVLSQEEMEWKTLLRNKKVCICLLGYSSERQLLRWLNVSEVKTRFSQADLLPWLNIKLTYFLCKRMLAINTITCCEELMKTPITDIKNELALSYPDAKTITAICSNENPLFFDELKTWLVGLSYCYCRDKLRLFNTPDITHPLAFIFGASLARRDITPLLPNYYFKAMKTDIFLLNERDLILAAKLKYIISNFLPKYEELQTATTAAKIAELKLKKVIFENIIYGFITMFFTKHSPRSLMFLAYHDPVIKEIFELKLLKPLFSQIIQHVYRPQSDPEYRFMPPTRQSPVEFLCGFYAFSAASAAYDNNLFRQRASYIAIGVGFNHIDSIGLTIKLLIGVFYLAADTRTARKSLTKALNLADQAVKHHGGLGLLMRSFLFLELGAIANMRNDIDSAQRCYRVALFDAQNALQMCDPPDLAHNAFRELPVLDYLHNFPLIRSSSFFQPCSISSKHAYLDYLQKLNQAYDRVELMPNLYYRQA